MNSLLSFHQSILEPILSDWLLSADLCNLDTAVCCREQRNYLLDILAFSRVSDVEDLDLRYYDEYYEWVNLRSIAMTSIVLEDHHCKKPSPVIHSFLRSKFLSTLKTPVCWEVIQLAKTYGLKIKKLVVSCFNGSLLKLLKVIGPHLEHLDLGRCKMSSKWGPRIAELAPHLKSCWSHSLIKGSVLQKCPILSMNNVSWTDLPGMSEGVTGCIVRANDNDTPVLTIGGKAFVFENVELSETCTLDGVANLLPFLAHITKCTLNFCGVDVMRSALSHTRCLTSLEVFCLCKLDETAVGEWMKPLGMLKKLIIYGCHVTDGTLLSLAEYCPLLETLRTVIDSFSKSAQQRLVQGCPQLLSLRCMSVIEKHLFLHKAVNLTSIMLQLMYSNFYCIDVEESSFQYSCNSYVSDSWYLLLFTQNPAITIIYFTGVRCSDSTFKSILKQCPLLTQISIENCKYITSKGLYCTQYCKQLTALDYTSTWTVNKLSLHQLLCDQNSMKVLRLRHCQDLQGKELKWMAIYCPGIRRVDLTGCVKITDYYVIKLLDDCVNLSNLNLNGCTNITAAILPNIKCRPSSCYRKVRYLNVEETLITQTDIDALGDFISNCYVEH